jgi:hypothetical protein
MFVRSPPYMDPRKNGAIDRGAAHNQTIISTHYGCSVGTCGVATQIAELVRKYRRRHVVHGQHSCTSCSQSKIKALKLNADYLLEGSVRREGQAVRVTAQLF